MITFYATTPHGYTFRKFLADWAPELADQVEVLGYSTLDLRRRPTPGLHILTDFERLLPPEKLLVRRLHRRLARTPGIRVIGNPNTWLGRHALLKVLHEEGINDFRAYTVDELHDDIRYPVFLRWANSHDGSLGKPVGNRKALDKRLATIAHDNHRRWRWIRDQLLIVEQVKVDAPEGYYRKYSIFRLGDEFIPRHVNISTNWVTKNPDVVAEWTVAEEEAFYAEPRDAELVKRVFDLSGIEYGRIDWGYVDGRPQIWEINTNPMLGPGYFPAPVREPSQRRQTGLISRSLADHVPPPLEPSSRRLVPAPERWGWNVMNEASRRWDPRRR